MVDSTNLQGTLQLLPQHLAVCRLAPRDAIPEWALGSRWFTLSRTEDELSIICEQDHVPVDVKCERDFRLLKLGGPLPFSAVGILADLSRVLADVRIPILAVSTYDTDYLLVREAHVKSAIVALESSGYIVTGA